MDPQASAPNGARECAAFPPGGIPRSGRAASRDRRVLKRKENSSRGPCGCLQVQLRRRHSGCPRYGGGMLTAFPFDLWRPRAPVPNGFHLCLRIDSPVSNRCSHGTFLCFSLQSSHLNNCYSYQDLHWGRFHAGSRPHASAPPPRPPTHWDLSPTSPQWLWIGRTLERHPFSGLMHSAGELLHTP